MSQAGGFTKLSLKISRDNTGKEKRNLVLFSKTGVHKLPGVTSVTDALKSYVYCTKKKQTFKSMFMVLNCCLVFYLCSKLKPNVRNLPHVLQIKELLC